MARAYIRVSPDGRSELVTRHGHFHGKAGSRWGTEAEVASAARGLAPGVYKGALTVQWDMPVVEIGARIDPCKEAARLGRIIEKPIHLYRTRSPGFKGKIEQERLVNAAQEEARFVTSGFHRLMTGWCAAGALGRDCDR